MQSPEVLDPEAAGKEMACAVTVQVQIDVGRSIVLQTYLPRDAEVKVYHDTLDKLGKAIDRQQAKYQLDGFKANLELHERTLKNLLDDFKAIDGRAEAAWQQRQKKGPMQLSPNEAAQKTTAATNIKRYRDEITKIEAEIAKCEGVIARTD